jgi:predicted dehydrogenase
VLVYAAGGVFLDPDIVKIPDSACVTLTFEDGSVCTTLISSAGCPDFEKESTEIYCDNKAIHIDGFRQMKYFGFEGHRQTLLDIGTVDKGQEAEIQMFGRSILEDSPPPNDILVAARAAVISYKVNESIRTGLPVAIAREEYDFS